MDGHLPGIHVSRRHVSPAPAAANWTVCAQRAAASHLFVVLPVNYEHRHSNPLQGRHVGENVETAQESVVRHDAQAGHEATVDDQGMHRLAPRKPAAGPAAHWLDATEAHQGPCETGLCATNTLTSVPDCPYTITFVPVPALATTQLYAASMSA